MITKFIKNEKGVVGLYLAILVLFVVAGIGASLSLTIFAQQKTMQNAVQSAKAYYAAESGAEDALLRVSRGMNFTDDIPYTFPVGNAAAQATIAAEFPAGTRTITAQGDASARIRKAQAVYEISATTPGFYYGAQVGSLGVEMENNSQIIGNVFSNGSFTLDNNAVVTGTVEISGGGNELNDGSIGGDAYVDTCTNATVTGTLYALTNNGCSVGAFVSQSPPAPIPLPIATTTINQWKSDAEAGGTITGNYTRSSGTSSLGPQKITGNMTIQNDAHLVLMGTVWVQGNVIIKNNAQVRLDSGYGSTSGVLIADGTILLENNSISSGSGQAGSYLMYLSTSSVDPAILIKNNAIVDILYTSAGFVQVENNAAMREITGNGVRIKNNATVTYQIGLQTAAFTSGPGGGWTVTSWQEVP